jgi:hypothetical protein
MDAPENCRFDGNFAVPPRRRRAAWRRNSMLCRE